MGSGKKSVLRKTLSDFPVFTALFPGYDRFLGSIVNRWATKEAKKAIIYEVCECKSHFSIQWTSWDMGINPSMEIWSRSMRTKRKYKPSLK